MALTNAERQARYRARLKARASGEATGELVHKAVDEAVEALWSFFSRPAPDGGKWGDTEGCADLAQYRAALTGSLVETCRALAWTGNGLTGPEKTAIQRIVEIADALDMTRPAPKLLKPVALEW